MSAIPPAIVPPLGSPGGQTSLEVVAARLDGRAVAERRGDQDRPRDDEHHRQQTVEQSVEEPGSQPDTEARPLAAGDRLLVVRGRIRRGGRRPGLRWQAGWWRWLSGAARRWCGRWRRRGRWRWRWRHAHDASVPDRVARRGRTPIGSAVRTVAAGGNRARPPAAAETPDVVATSHRRAVDDRTRPECFGRGHDRDDLVVGGCRRHRDGARLVLGHRRHVRPWAARRPRRRSTRSLGPGA